MLNECLAAVCPLRSHCCPTPDDCLRACKETPISMTGHSAASAVMTLAKDDYLEVLVSPLKVLLC